MAWKFTGDRAVYLQIAERVKKAVLSGVYPPGEQIPSVRQLALEAAVNPNTVQHAFTELENQGIHPDVVVVDPPRKGLNSDTIEALARMSPRRIVYVSCDPATLGRDVALLKEKGYYVQNAMACDLFPRTVHVETVILLSRKDVHERIKFDVNVEDLIK